MRSVRKEVVEVEEENGEGTAKWLALEVLQRRRRGEHGEKGRGGPSRDVLLFRGRGEEREEGGNGLRIHDTEQRLETLQDRKKSVLRKGFGHAQLFPIIQIGNATRSDVCTTDKQGETAVKTLLLIVPKRLRVCGNERIKEVKRGFNKLVVDGHLGVVDAVLQHEIRVEQHRVQRDVGEILLDEGLGGLKLLHTKRVECPGVRKRRGIRNVRNVLETRSRIGCHGTG